MQLPFTATTDTGIKIYRLNEYNNMNEQAKLFMSYLNSMLEYKRLANLKVEYHANAQVFNIYNVEMPNYSFSVHCTHDENCFIVAPQNISPNTQKMKLMDLRRYVESFFYQTTEWDLSDN